MLINNAALLFPKDFPGSSPNTQSFRDYATFLTELLYNSPLIVTEEQGMVQNTWKVTTHKKREEAHCQTLLICLGFTNSTLNQSTLESFSLSLNNSWLFNFCPIKRFTMHNLLSTEIVSMSQGLFKASLFCSVHLTLPMKRPTKMDVFLSNLRLDNTCK